VKIPSLILKQLYTHGSLENLPEGVRFGLKNRLSDAVVTGISEIRVDKKVVPLSEIEAGVALAGEISLGAAISSLDWVSSHEKYGRNR